MGIHSQTNFAWVASSWFQSYKERRLPIRASKENLIVVDWRLPVHKVAGHPVGSEKELGKKLLSESIHVYCI